MKKTTRSFQEAKGIEVRNFVAAEAFETLPDHLKPSLTEAIGMRWILTWKLKEDGSYKAKARAILKGFQDPQYEYRETTTPVMTRMTRQIILQIAAQRRWRVRKGDVTGAFLQGREYPGQLYCVPTPEIAKALGIKEGDIVRVKRGCYGLVDAPIEWYRSVSQFMEQDLGLTKSWSDPCLWFYEQTDGTNGMVAGHVDDFLFAGPRDHSGWNQVIERIQKRFKWSDWEEKSFVQCGVTIEEQADGSFHLSEPGYVDKIAEINVRSQRRKEKNLPTTEREKTSLRALLGGLSWHAQQVAPHFSAEVSLMLSEVKDSTVESIHRANQLLQEAKARKDHKLIVHSFPKQEELGVFCWSDAAGQNRREGGSTQGIFIGMAPVSMLQGNMEKVSPILWSSNKIDRVVRSPGAAETRAVVTGEDLLYHVRF